MDVTVYLGAHEGDNPVYKQAVVELATWIAQNGHRLVLWRFRRGTDGGDCRHRA